MRFWPKVGALIFIFSPLVTISIIGFASDIWADLYSKESLSTIITHLEELYTTNPFALITILGTAFGLITYYYGTIINSENKYSKISENLESRLKAIGFFTVLPTFILTGYFLINISQLIYAKNIIIAYFFILIFCQQVYILKKFQTKLQNHYNYSNLLDAIINLRDPLSSLKSLYSGEKNAEKYLEQPLLIFHLAWLFLFLFILLKTDISTILILILFWLIFASTTEISVFYSLATARYFLVDIKLQDQEFMDAIFIREEKDNFIRIIPKPSDSKKEGAKKEYNGILVNKNHILSINYHLLSENSLENI